MMLLLGKTWKVNINFNLSGKVLGVFSGGNQNFFAFSSSKFFWRQLYGRIIDAREVAILGKLIEQTKGFETLVKFKYCA